MASNFGTRCTFVEQAASQTLTWAVNKIYCPLMDFFLQARIDLSSLWFVRWQGNTKHHRGLGHIGGGEKKEGKKKKIPPPSLFRRRKGWNCWGHFVWFIGNKVDLINILIKRNFLHWAGSGCQSPVRLHSLEKWNRLELPSVICEAEPHQSKKANGLPPPRGSLCARCSPCICHAKRGSLMKESVL